MHWVRGFINDKDTVCQNQDTLRTSLGRVHSNFSSCTLIYILWMYSLQRRGGEKRKLREMKKTSYMEGGGHKCRSRFLIAQTICVVQNLTLPNETVRTKIVSFWKKKKIEKAWWSSPSIPGKKKDLFPIG